MVKVIIGIPETAAIGIGCIPSVNQRSTVTESTIHMIFWRSQISLKDHKGRLTVQLWVLLFLVFTLLALLSVACGERLGATTKEVSTNSDSNIRELQHAIERAIIMSDENQLLPEDFLLSSRNNESNSVKDDNFNLEEVEKSVVQMALNKHAGNISKAAKELGLTRAALYRRLEKHGL